MLPATVDISRLARRVTVSAYNPCNTTLPPRKPAGFTVTAERSRLVQFLFPSHYSSGAAVFAPDGLIEGVSSWGDLSGRTLSVLEGNYVLDAAPQTPALQNVTLLPVQSIEGGQSKPWGVCMGAQTPGSASTPPACSQPDGSPLPR